MTDCDNAVGFCRQTILMMKIPVIYELLGDVSVTQFLLLTLFLLAAAYYFYANRHHGVWEKLGVPGPKPWPIFDHKFEQKKGENVIKKWFNEYGNTFGAYGILPQKAVLVTRDLSLVKQILVKDFECFMDRNRPRKTYSSMQYGLTAAVDERWRRTRHVTSPMFTGAKMKAIITHVCASAETLTQLAKQYVAKGQLVPLKLFASKFSTEVIARIAFGVDTHAVSDEESEFAAYTKNLIRLDSKFLEYVEKVYQYFPAIDDILRFFNISTDFINKNSDKYFVSILKSTIQERKKNKIGQVDDKPRDLLDMLIKTEVKDNDPKLKDVDSKSLSPDEIIGNSTMLIVAGVETVSTTFSSILYCLALYPDVQTKLVAEIDSIFPKGTSVNYDQLKELQYTEQVIYECLRMFPLISVIHRIAAETKTYGNITIPKGSYIHISLGEIMKDPEHWPDPEKFDPDRFSSENKAGRDPLAFVPFGYGPRICLGMRLALVELKVILVYLLREVKFALSDRTEPKLGEKLVMKLRVNIALRPAKPIMLEVLPRY